MKKLVLFLIVHVVLLTAATAQVQVDYRKYQSPVKNQVNRGTCTAFAILAAMETLPGFPTDLSEQWVYAMAKMKHYKEYESLKYEQGASLKFYIDVLETEGTLREDQEPYNPNAVIWDKTEANFERMKKDLGGTRLYDLLGFPPFAFKLYPKMYNYRSGEQARDVEWIKQRLNDGVRAIPVGYSVNSYYWSQHHGQRASKMDPSDFLKIGEDRKGFSVAKLQYPQNQLFDKLHSGELEAYYTDTAYTVNEGHAVAIVGYDENGFLIKNSWGIDEWGNKGYGWVSFDYHRLFCSEVLAISLGKVDVSDFSMKEDNVWKAADFQVKSMPHDYESSLLNMKSKGIALSVVYHGNGKMPRFESIEYKAYDAGGKLLGSWYGNTHGIFDGRESGYETYILSADQPDYPYAEKLVATFKTDKGQTFTNTYRNIRAVNREYKAEM